jgi:serine protease AprX
MLIIIAAGNDGMAVPRAQGAKTNSANGFVDWPSVAAPATAKNGLTVGASRSSRTKGGYAALKFGQAWQDRYPNPPIGNEFVSGNANCLAAFSSRGPSDETALNQTSWRPGPT